MPQQLGQIVTLAGPWASEIPYLRDKIRAPGSLTWFVDEDLRGIQAVERSWEQARTFCGDLECLLESDLIRALRFVNFDFCGAYSTKASDVVRASRGKYMAGAIVSLTFLCCRDHGTAQRIFQLAPDVEDRFEQRCVGTKRALDEDLGVKTESLSCVLYRRPGSKSSLAQLVVRVP